MAVDENTVLVSVQGSAENFSRQISLGSSGSSVEMQDPSNYSNNKNYTKETKLMRELICSICLFYFGLYAPKKVFRPIFGINMRPIPYQKLSTGDVVLDLELNNPLEDSPTIPSKLLFHTSVTVPLIIMVLFTRLVPHPNCPVKYLDTHSCACVLLMTIGLTEFTTHMAKMYVGRLRPNFYQLCQFDTELLECTADPKHILESRSSFPSGHSSISAAGMGVLVFFLVGRVGIGRLARHDNRKRKFQNPKIYVLLAILPLFWSFFVACSRLVDHWHHPGDIVAGLCLGFLFPPIVYHLFYPSVLSRQAGVPLNYLASGA